MTAPRRFQLMRDVDHTGVSNTGLVADGVVWPDGSVAIRWRGQHASTVVWASLDDAMAVHGHGGHTRCVWLDPVLLTNTTTAAPVNVSLDTPSLAGPPPAGPGDESPRTPTYQIRPD